MDASSTYKKPTPQKLTGAQQDHRVVVGLSGGIHGAVVAALLKAQGREVHGVHLTLRSDSDSFPSGCTQDSQARAEKAAADAKRLGISFTVVDATDRFTSAVEDPFLQDRLNGRYSNPCFRCHTQFKIGGLLNEAQKLKINRVATGHRVALRKDQLSGQYHLFRSATSETDDSRFLVGLSQSELTHLEFPLGEVPASVVQKIAIEIDESWAVPSQKFEVCFNNKQNGSAYMSRLLPAYFKNPGLIRVGGGGSAIGEHRGFWQYSYGCKVSPDSQNLTQDKSDWVIAHYDSTQNTFAVIPRGDWLSRRWLLSDFHGVAPLNQLVAHSVQVQLISAPQHWPERPQTIEANLLCLDAGRLLLEFQQAVPLLIGETLVFEKEQELFGMARVFSQLDRQKTSSSQQDSWGTL